MIDSNTPTPAATIPTSPSAPGGPPANMTAPPGTAMEMAQLLHTKTIDPAQAGKLARAGNISGLHVAQALHVLREAGEPHEQFLIRSSRGLVKSANVYDVLIGDKKFSDFIPTLEAIVRLRRHRR